MKRLSLLLILAFVGVRAASAQEAEGAKAPEAPAAEAVKAPEAPAAEAPAAEAPKAPDAAAPSQAEAPAADGPACTECHDAIDRTTFDLSAHGKKGNAGCTSCHADVKATSDGHDTPKPVDCARCHAEASAKYTEGLHSGKKDKEGDAPRATCVQCHGNHAIPRLGKIAPAEKKQAMEAMCKPCHGTEVSAYTDGRHGRSSNSEVATCTDCHGNHEMRSKADPASPGSPVARANVPQTCGKCHEGVTRTYQESVHGRELAKGNTDVPVCTDCHHSHEIRSHYDPKSATYATHVSETCLKCHADQATIRKYDFPGLRAETYAESYHGAASKLGDTTVANCASCHSSHDIRASSDPKSSTHPDRLAATCGKCHTTDNPSKSMLSGKIHVETARQSHWITDLVFRLYMVLIAGTLGFFAFFIAIDLRRALRHRRAK